MMENVYWKIPQPNCCIVKKNGFICYGTRKNREKYINNFRMTDSLHYNLHEFFYLA